MSTRPRTSQPIWVETPTNDPPAPIGRKRPVVLARCEMQEPCLLTIQEAAGLMRVHRNTISRWIAQGLLIAIGTGQTKRIPIENLLNMRKAG